MEGLGLNPNFWKDKRVFITGHTGFKGSWLSIWLSQMGAKVTGYSLSPPTKPSLFEIAKVKSILEKSYISDIRNFDKLKQAIKSSKPEVVIHMAAQPLVRDSYKIPIETYSTNVMGTVHILEALRTLGPGPKVFLNITTDKVYENKEWMWGYRENEPLGGYDPYSNSKACSELVTLSYRSSFFHPEKYQSHGLAVSTARAGNVIGGGDFATDRLIPDIIRSILKNEKVRIRNPDSIRPWQHVLEPLSGYLLLAKKMYEDGKIYSESWNFGPDENDTKSVLQIVESLKEKIEEKSGLQSKSRKFLKFPGFDIDKGINPHEANYLKLDISKAKSNLNWNPIWQLDTAFDKIIDWTEQYINKVDMRDICFKQIDEYCK